MGNENIRMMKRHKLVPLVLLIYLIVVGVFAWPGRNPDISYLQYGITIGVTVVCIVVLSYLLKKRDETRKKNREGKK